MRGVVLCNCEMCRRTHGHFGAYTAAAKSALRFVESRGLRWFASSRRARRGFCAECGASLFWEASDRDTISIAAGTLDAPTGLMTVLQVHVASAGDYYELPTGVPQRGD